VDRIRRKRPSLRLIVSSATLDAAAFLAYFTSGPGYGPEDATIASLEGRMFPVELAYLAAPAPDYVREAAETCCEINAKVHSGQVVGEARN
jgi:ATP-dependent RNA helicase DDX35